MLWTNRRWCDSGSERGSGSLLAVGIVAATLAMTVLFVPVAQALAVKQRVVGAADAAALAAADTASGAIAGIPCRAAQTAAEANQAQLARCDIAGAIATVSAHTGYLGFDISVDARAGPPPDSGTGPGSSSDQSN